MTDLYFIGASRFDYDLTDNTGNTRLTFYPGTINPSSNWFFNISDIEDECSTFPTIGCEANRIGCEGWTVTDMDRQVANHFIELSTAWPAQTRWVAEYNLYRKLLQCPALLQDNVMAAFFDRFEELESVRLYAEEEERLRNLYQAHDINDSLLHVYELLIVSIRNQTDSINRLLPLATDESTRQNLRQQLLALNQQFTEIIADQHAVYDAIQQNRLVELHDINADNLLATFTQQHELNMQQSSDIYLSTIARGENLPASSVSALTAMAGQCPYSGGPAVYQARAMLAMVQGPKSYNDELICYNANIAWRKKEDSGTNSVSIKPNPAKNEVTISYSLPKDETGLLQVYNSVGTIATAAVVDANSTHLKLNTSSLNNGIYYYKLTANETIIGQGKLIIVK